MLEAVCPNGHHLQVPLEHAGMKLRCPAPGCGVIFQLSASSPTGATMPVGAAAPPAPPPPPMGAPQQPAGAPNYAGQQPAPAPHVPNTGSSPAQPLSDAGGSRWTGTDQPQAQAPAAPPQQVPMSASGPVPRGPQAYASRGALSAPGVWLGLAQGVLMIGLTLVLTARGCDGLGARNVARLKAKVDQEKLAFENAYAQDVAQLQAELGAEKLAEKTRTDLQKRLDDRRKQHDADGRMNEVEWSALRNAATEAAAANIVWGYWREMLFVAGTILFSLGLLAVAVGGIGAERYLCFGMLAIVVFSVYVGGAAWFTSIAGSLSGLK